MYKVVEVRDTDDRVLCFAVAATTPAERKKLPRDNEFQDRRVAEKWVDDRLRKDERNARSRGRSEALRSVGMKKTRYGWE